MKRTLCNSRPIRSLSTLVLAAALLRALALPEAVAAGTPSLPVEQVLREFQARCYFVTGGYATWQPCRCGTPAPRFPPDGFYGDLDRDPVLATLLVRDLAAEFYSRSLYASFLKTPDGSSGIEDQPVVPNTLPLAYYTLADDMSPMVGGVDMSTPGNINITNYPDCFRALRGYIEKLNFVSVAVGSPGFSAKSGSGTSQDDCAAAKASAGNAYTSAVWPQETGGGELDPTEIYVRVQSWSQETLDPDTQALRTNYYAYKEAQRAQIYGTVGADYPRLAGGTILLYLAASNRSGGDGGNEPPVTADGKYHFHGSTPLGPNSDFYSPLLGDAANPSIATDCPLGNPIEEGWRVSGAFIILKPDFETDSDHVQCGEDACASCGGGGNLPGKVTTATGSLDVRISLGPDQYGRPAGYFYLHSEHPSPALFTPVSMLYSTPSATGSAAQWGSYTPTYHAAVWIEGINSGYGIFFTNWSGDFLASATITSNSLNPNQITITEQLGSVGSPRVIQFNYTNNGPTSWTWDMIEGGGLRTESRTTTWSTPSNRTDTIVVKGPDAVPVAQTVENYCRYPWGLTLVQRIEGTGTSARTTSWTYFTNAATDGGNYGQLNHVVEPSGRWEKYQYDAAGRLTNTVAQFGNNSTTAEASNRVTQVSYSEGTITTVVKLLNTEVARSYEVHAWDEGNALEQVQTIRCATPGAGIGAANNLTNIVWQATDDRWTGQAWDTLAELRPDGAMDLYQYPTQSSGSQVIVASGAPNWTWPQKVNWSPASTYGSMDGTQTTTTRGDWGEPLSVSVQDLASTLTAGLDSYEYSPSDPLRRSHTITHLDTSSETFTYSCCGLDTWRDRDSVTTHYFYDDAKRQTASLRLGILTTNILDAAGNVLSTIRYGSNGAPVVLRQAAYDLAGRVTSETNALGGFTIRAETFGSAGTTISTTYPDNGMRIELYNQDGSLQSVSGTAAFAAYYTHGVDTGGTFTKATKDSPSGSEWTKTYTDMLGRAYKTVYAGPDTPFSIAYYNAQGQVANEVDPDGVSMLYTYNAKGERACSILDSNRTHQIEWSGAGADRITLVTNDVTSEYGPTARRTRTFVWAESDDTPTLISSEAASADGLQTWSTVWNNGAALTRHSETVCDSATGLRVTTTTAPDNSSTVTTNQYGRLLSVTRKDGNDAPMGQTRYGYDTHGRPNTITDARTGTTTAHYDNADNITNTVSPIPGPGQSAQTTTAFFDKMNRLWKTVLPDSGVVTNDFYPTGQPRTIAGARTYPSGSGFDGQGRQTGLTNWTSFPSAGARATAWSYDPYRGWLSGKTYAGNSPGPSYGHTPAGRVQSRAWARGTNTTYAINLAGDLAGIGYADSTPGLTCGFDRRGRPTTVTQGSIVTTRAFDDPGDLLSESYSNGPLSGLAVSNRFDSLLRRTNLLVQQSSNPLIQQTFGFDMVSRLQTVSDGTNSATYAYLANSPLVSHVFFTNNGALRMVATKQHDNLNRLTNLAWTVGSQVVASFAYQYNNANQRTRVTLVDGSYWVYGYDYLGQVTSAKRYWVDGTPVAGQQNELAFDDIGNRKTASAGGDQAGANLRTAHYTNNSLNQITSRTVPGYLQVLGVANSNATVTLWSVAGPLATPAGNFAQTVRHGEYFSGELAPNNATGAVWLAITNLAVRQNGTNADHAATNVGHMFLPQTPEIYGYDEDGNLTNNGRITITWDAENRATSFTSLASNPLNSKRRVECTYDYSWRRTQKIVSTNNGSTYGAQCTQRFVYDGWNLVAELGANGALLRSHVWGLDASGSLQGAGGVGGLLATTIHTGPFAGTYFPAYDGSLNVVAYIRASDGQVVARYEYGPFGEMVRASGQMARDFNLLFSTKYYDWETGFYYYGHRYYDPDTGRWPNRDPFAENGGLNLYGFTRNNPINRVDSIGLAEASGTVNGPSAWKLGWEWLTGTGEEHRDFGWNDQLTQDLRRGPQIQAALAAAKKALDEKCKGYRPGIDYGPYPVDAQGDSSNGLSGPSGPFKYIRDYSVIVTGERFGGNLTVTFLGSFNGDWRAVGDCCTRKGRICFTIKNSSSLASGTRFPVTGYWSDDYTATLWEMITFQDFGIPSGIFPSRPPGSTGPGRTISQTFKWCEDLNF